MNALQRNKERVKVPYSKMDLEVLDSLAKYNYLDEVSRKGRGVKRIIDIKLKYDQEHKPVISSIKLISRPSKKIYLGWRDIKKSKQGYGNYFLSTPKGIMSGYEARKNKIGGELLFEIW